MPAALGHLGRCWPSIGLRFTHARRNAAPSTVPHGPRPDGAGPTAAPIARTPARQAHGTPAAHPIAAAGACRGCCPAAVTLCANRAALARAFIYNLFAIANRCGEYRFFRGGPGGQVGRARAGRVGPKSLRIASHGHRMRLRPRWLSNVGYVAATWHGAPLRAREGTAERWHGVCVPGLGADILSPAPRQSQCAAGWLEYQNRVPVFGMRL
jgi:hypothetical protein